MLARVISFYAEDQHVRELVESLRDELPAQYEELAGFRGVLVLEKPGNRNHVIAVTLWEDEAAMEASKELADKVASRVTTMTGNASSRGSYNVIGRIRVGNSV
jgi:quinol monooxygenase YgiN